MIDQETGVVSLVGGLCTGGIELARDSFVICEAGSYGHSEDDDPSLDGLDGPATGPSGFFRRAFRSLPKRYFCEVVVFLHSCFRQLGGKMVKFWRRWLLLLLLLEIVEMSQV